MFVKAYKCQHNYWWELLYLTIRDLIRKIGNKGEVNREVMKKLMKGICIFLMLILFCFCFYYVYMYHLKYNKIQIPELTSKEMRDEIIRQLKEKEGMTFEEYLIKQYFKKMMEEINE